MSSQRTADRTAAFRVQHIGGIDETTVTVSPGVTVLTGRNATNRSSFLQAIAAAMGSDNATLKGDADEGRVELELGGETYTRTYSRSNGTVSSAGDPYLGDPDVADTFAFLFTDNEARNAVVRNRDLHELIMEPVDMAAIEAEIRDLETKKDELTDELEAVNECKRELPELEQERTRLETEIENERDRLEETERAIDSMETDVESRRLEQAELEERLSELSDKRAEKERVRSDIDVQRESINSLQAERRELEAEASELSDTPESERTELRREIESLRGRTDDLEREVDILQDLIQFNEEMVEGESSTDVRSVLYDDDGGSDVTDQLVEDRVRCWTCGSDVARDQIQETIERLRDERATALETIGSLEDELAERTAEQRENERNRERRETIDRRLDEITEEITDREASVETLQKKRTQLSEEIEALEREVEALETAEVSDILDLHREANQLEFEIERLESERADTRERLAAIEDRLSEASRLQERYDSVTERLTELRTRSDRIEEEAVDAFNRHMNEVLDILEYDNLERIWVERRETRQRDGRRFVDETEFELHVVRTSDGGATYEDTVDHLSESEREITGLLFALAGYLVHDLHETVPFLLLDSVEAIDADRLADLVPYLAKFAEYLVVALLPEDARALDDEYDRVTEI